MPDVIPINILESTVKNLNMPILVDSKTRSGPVINFMPVNIIILATMVNKTITAFKNIDIFIFFILTPILLCKYIMIDYKC